MKKSASVTLTVVAAVGCAAAQQAVDPCAPGAFNTKVCRTAVKSQGFCDGATWVPQQYQKYSYYSGVYKAYAAAGGVTTPAPAGACRPNRVPVSHGGFGAIGLVHSSAVS